MGSVATLLIAVSHLMQVGGPGWNAPFVHVEIKSSEAGKEVDMAFKETARYRWGSIAQVTATAGDDEAMTAVVLKGACQIAQVREQQYFFFVPRKDPALSYDVRFTSMPADPRVRIYSMEDCKQPVP